VYRITHKLYRNYLLTRRKDNNKKKLSKPQGSVKFAAQEIQIQPQREKKNAKEPDEDATVVVRTSARRTSSPIGRGVSFDDGRTTSSKQKKTSFSLSADAIVLPAQVSLRLKKDIQASPRDFFEGQETSVSSHSTSLSSRTSATPRQQGRSSSMAHSNYSRLIDTSRAAIGSQRREGQHSSTTHSPR
jgi:hypothetical protein